MADRWFYAHDDKKIGPFSGRQLRDLADTRQILPTDTVWKEGIDQGVFATRVRYLFSATQIATPPVSVSVLTSEILIPAELKTVASPHEAKPGKTLIPDDPATGTLPDDIQLRPEASAPAPPKQTSVPQPTVRKRRALAIKGAVIVSQDGTKVRYRKKCAICGFEEASWSMLPITDGMMRTNFFCPKCRKKEDVVIRGSFS